MSKSVEPSRFNSHIARMSREFDSRKQRPRMLVKLGFRKLCDSNLFGLYPLDNMAISLIQERSKSESPTVRHQSWKSFCDPHWELICHNKSLPGTSEIAVGTHYHAWYGHGPYIFARSLLVATSKFSLRTTRQHSATRKHLLLYLQGDRSSLKKPKKGKHEY